MYQLVKNVTSKKASRRYLLKMNLCNKNFKVTSQVTVFREVTLS